MEAVIAAVLIPTGANSEHLLLDALSVAAASRCGGCWLGRRRVWCVAAAAGGGAAVGVFVLKS